jgi:hypothetical protein
VFKSFVTLVLLRFFFTCAFIFHFLLNNLIQWSHLNTLVVNSWFILAFLILYFQKFDHNCCMAHFLFQVKEGHYLSTTFMLWWKRAIIFENVAIFYLDLFMKNHRKDKNIRKPDLVFYTDISRNPVFDFWWIPFRKISKYEIFQKIRKKKT